MANEGAPTVILAKTVKGWTLGPDIEARNVTHQIKKMSSKQLRELRERLYLQDEVPLESIDEEDELPPYYRPHEGSDTYKYMMERRHALGGSVPKRRSSWTTIDQPAEDAFGSFLKGLSLIHI